MLMNKVFRLLFVLPLAVFVLFAVQPALAQSSAEDVAMAFYKTGGITPKFRSWIKNSETYQNTQPARRLRHMESELERLRTKFAALDPARKTLSIETEGTVILDQDPQSPGLTLRFERPATSAGLPLIFPYENKGTSFGLYAQELDPEIIFHLPAGPDRTFDARLKNDRTYPVRLILKPVQSRTEAPVGIGKNAIWILETDLAGLTIETETGLVLWRYDASIR